MDYLFENFTFPPDQSFTIRSDKLTLKKYTCLKSHENFELTLIENCLGKRFIGDSVEDFDSPDLILIGAYVPHCWQFYKSVDRKKEAKATIVHFFPNFMGEEFLQKPEARGMKALFENAKRGIHFQGSIIPESKKILGRLLKSRGLCRLGLILQLFDLLSGSKNKKELSTEGFNPVSTFSESEKINKVYEYVFKNFAAGIELEKVADVIFLSPAAFCRFFKEKTNKTLFDYVKEVRIGYAAKLLLEKKYSISEICYKCGYNNLSSFNKQFKEIKDMTPSVFLNYYTD
jgi:AraC-like DNA-binding protein